MSALGWRRRPPRRWPRGRDARPAFLRLEARVLPAVFTVNSAIRITATVPAGAGTGKISVTTPAGTGSSATSFTAM